MGAWIPTPITVTRPRRVEHLVDPAEPPGGPFTPDHRSDSIYAILFGLGSPTGIINHGLAKPAFKDFGRAEVRFESSGSARTRVVERTGTDLREVLTSRGALDPAHAVEIVTAVCDALAVSHAVNLIHRDIKPENILIARDGTVKVTDFGIAVVTDVEYTLPGGTIPGTIRYLSPEQARGDSASPATDTWGAGALLFELLTGEELRAPAVGEAEIPGDEHVAGAFDCRRPQLGHHAAVGRPVGDHRLRGPHSPVGAGPFFVVRDVTFDQVSNLLGSNDPNGLRSSRSARWARSESWVMSRMANPGARAPRPMHTVQTTMAMIDQKAGWNVASRLTFFSVRPIVFTPIVPRPLTG